MELSDFKQSITYLKDYSHNEVLKKTNDESAQMFV